MTEIAPPPGAQAVAGLRARTRAARRIALIALTGSLALLSATQLLAERAAPTREIHPLAAPTATAQPLAEPTPEAPPQAARTQKPLPSTSQPAAVPPSTAPPSALHPSAAQPSAVLTSAALAVLALVVFVGVLPVLVITQAAWGARVRETRRREHELYATPPASRSRPLSRLGMACGWVLVVLLGGALPRLFADAGRHAVATVLAGAVNVLAMAATAAGMCCCLWWARDRLRRAGRTGGVPGDPWDPGRGARRRRRGVVLWAGAAVGVAALLGARAHFWTPPTPMIFVLLVTTFACLAVTDE